MGQPEPAERFSHRVADYIRYRPGYPHEVMATLRADFGLAPHHVIADVGGGTGISTELLLSAGHPVFAVEPNEAMRAAAEQRLASKYSQFTSLAASAERTTLPDASVDWVVAAQSFHWFDVDACRVEFRRILRTPPRVALLWNNRREDGPFLSGFEGFLREYAVDYTKVKHQQVEEDGRLDRFFAPGWQQRTFPNMQTVDYDGLLGRVRSASYMPAPDHPRFEEMCDALRRLFDAHAESGTVTLLYDTRLYVGVLA